MSRTASDARWLRVLPLLLALVILPMPQVPASAADTSGVTGIVTNNETGSPVVRASVTVYAPGQRVPLMTTTSDASGRYAIRGLSSGHYVLRASAHGFATIFSGGAPTWQHADTVSLSDGETRTQDFALSPAARITGSVTSGGAPVPGVAVAVLRAVDGTAVRWQRTDADGAYAIGGLPAGNYKIRAQEPGYLRSFHDGSATLQSAAALALPVGGSVTVRFTLVPEGTIAGRVTDRSGTPIAEALITGFDADGEIARSVRSDAAGNYRLRGLRTGEYRLRVGAPEFKASFYGPATSLGSATAILVRAGQAVEGVGLVLAERSSSDAVSSLPDTPTTASPELGAYSWVQVLRSGGDAALAAQLEAWAERGGDMVIVDVSPFADISEIRDPVARAAEQSAALDRLESVHDAAASAGLEVTALAGSPAWFTPGREYVMPIVLDSIAQYNRTAPRPIRHLEFDVEPWSQGMGWDRAGYLHGLSVAVEHAASLGTDAPRIGATVPYWFDDPSNPMGLGPGAEHSLFSEVVNIIARSDGGFVTVMDYRSYVDGPGGLIDSVAGEFAAVRGTGVHLNVAIDIMPSEEVGATLHGITAATLGEAVHSLHLEYGGTGALGHIVLNALDGAIRLEGAIK